MLAGTAHPSSPLKFLILDSWCKMIDQMLSTCLPSTSHPCKHTSPLPSCKFLLIHCLEESSFSSSARILDGNLMSFLSLFGFWVEQNILSSLSGNQKWSPVSQIISISQLTAFSQVTDLFCRCSSSFNKAWLFCNSYSCTLNSHLETKLYRSLFSPFKHKSKMY